MEDVDKSLLAISKKLGQGNKRQVKWCDAKTPGGTSHS